MEGPGLLRRHLAAAEPVGHRELDAAALIQRVHRVKANGMAVGEAVAEAKRVGFIAH